MVSAELGPFQKLEGAKNKGRATSLQHVLVPWLISKYGMLYKSARMDHGRSDPDGGTNYR